MFSRKEAKAPAAPVRTAAPAPIRSGATAPSMKRMERQAPPSIIGSDIVVSGTLTSGGQMQIDGKVKGDVRCAILVIGEPGLVEGDVTAEDVTVRGHVKGNILAHKVHLSSTCRVEGDIHRQSMSVESGAHFEGHSRHSDSPLSGGSSKQAEGLVKLAR